MDVKFLEKRWIPKPVPDTKIVTHLTNELKVSKILATLIAQRGIQTFEEAKNYFNPKIEELHDPFLMKGMNNAIDRIHKAIHQNENILIYGDYDVDGTTSVALTYSFFSNFSQNISTYVPDRFKEGYGISKEGIDYAIEQSCSLMIALDCGIKEVELTHYANSNNIDLIICDHHTPGKIIPDAFEILNPKQKNCTYPYKELSGCGIGFKLIQAYQKRYETEIDPFDFIDYVAVSIASDIVPITGENRILTYLGLQKINNDPIIPFRALIHHLELNKELNVTDLVFIFGPRLNASGRISHAKNTVKFLTEKDLNRASQYLNEINSRNKERKNLDQDIVEQALEVIAQDESLVNRKTTVLWDQNWHKGVIGIVASRLIETYYRPTIILTESEGKLTGSARSVSGFNLYNAIEACSDLLEQFGGHQYAAGLTLKKENFEAFQSKFEEIVSQTIKPEMLIPSIEYDIEIDVNHLSLKFVKTIDRFGPFGPGNMKPKFVSAQVTLAFNPRIVGEHHLKLAIKTSKGFIDAIAFKMGHFLTSLKKGTPIDICYTIEENSWNGDINLQLNIKDIKLGK